MIAPLQETGGTCMQLPPTFVISTAADGSRRCEHLRDADAAKNTVKSTKSCTLVGEHRTDMFYWRYGYMKINREINGIKYLID